MIKIAVVGGRNFSDVNLANRILTYAKEHYENIMVISGGAKGADAIGEQWAKDHNIPVKIFPAEWGKYGKSAGFKRNQLIVDECDLVIAFWDGKSKGTADTINKAKALGKAVYVFWEDQNEKYLDKLQAIQNKIPNREDGSV